MNDQVKKNNDNQDQIKKSIDNLESKFDETLQFIKKQDN